MVKRKICILFLLVQSSFDFFYVTKPFRNLLKAQKAPGSKLQIIQFAPKPENSRLWFSNNF